MDIEDSCDFEKRPVENAPPTHPCPQRQSHGSSLSHGAAQCAKDNGSWRDTSKRLWSSSDLIFPPLPSLSGRDMISNAERGMPYKWYSCAATQKWKYLILLLLHVIIIDNSLTLRLILSHSVLQGFHTGRFLFNRTAAVYNLEQCSLPLNLDAVKSPHHPYEPWILWKQMTAGNKSFLDVEICPQLNSWDRCECRSRFTQPFGCAASVL